MTYITAIRQVEHFRRGDNVVKRFYASQTRRVCSHLIKLSNLLALHYTHIYKEGGYLGFRKENLINITIVRKLEKLEKNIAVSVS